MKLETILRILKRRYNFTWIVLSNRSINWNGRCGFVGEKPIRTKQMVEAIADLLVKRYEDRRERCFGKYRVKPDLSARSQEELLSICPSGTIWRWDRRQTWIRSGGGVNDN